MMDKARNDFLPKAIAFAVRQITDSRVNTVEPGIVEEYDSDTKRARIGLVMRRAFKDGRPSIPKAPLVDVPVIQSGTGGYLFHQEIRKDDIVLVCFSKEGLDNFKENWGRSEPVPGRRFVDAIAIPWGNPYIEPISNEGIVLQSADGKTSIHLKDGLIEMRVGETVFRMTPDEGRIL